MSYTVGEFANEIRKKYPKSYDDWDDSSLVAGVIEKYPEYKDWVNFEPSPAPPQPLPNPYAIPQERLVAQQETLVSPLSNQIGDWEENAAREQRHQLMNEGVEQQKQIYNEYERQFYEQLKKDNQIRKQKYDEAVQNGTLPEGFLTGTEYDFMSGRLLSGKGKANPEQHANWEGGSANITMGNNLWWPENKELEKASFLQNLGAGIEQVSSSASMPLRKNLGLANENTDFINANRIAENLEIEKRKKEYKNMLAQGLDIGEEGREFLDEHDPGFFTEFWRGLKETPGFMLDVIKDPEIRRQFLDDMAMTMPASMAASAGVGGIASVFKAAHAAKKTQALIDKIRKAKGTELSLEQVKKTKEFSEALRGLEQAMTENPLAVKYILKDMVIDELAQTVVESLINVGQGGNFNFAENLGENFAMDIVPHTAIKTGHKALKKFEEGENYGKGYVTKKEFNKSFGEDGAILNEADTRGAEQINTFAAREDRADQVRQLAKRHDNNYTSQDKNSFLSEIPDDLVAEAASHLPDDLKAETTNRLNGYRKGNVNYITPQGHTGTQAHETLHGLENHPELKAELAEWVADTKEWAKENGVSLPEDGELVAETFTHKLGYKEPNWRGVENIPVPDDLANRMAEALGLGEAGMRKSPDVSHETMKGEKVYDSEGNYQGYKTEDGEMLPFSLKKNTTDAEYMKAVESGDMEKAQKFVDEQAKKKGYSAEDVRTMEHKAPNSKDADETNVKLATVMESGIVPDDYWTHPQYYQSDAEEMSSFHTIRSAISEYKRTGKAYVMMYRAVPKYVKDGSFRNGDWVTPSRSYAEGEGESISGGYKIIEKKVSLNNLWWDANSINEFGYDDGKNYAYANTKNNRKLLDTVTRDFKGNVIPPSKRFNKQNSYARFSLTKNETPEQQAKAEEYKKGISQKEAIDKLKSVLGESHQTILKNAEGEEVRLASTSIGKLLSNAAVKKSMDNGFKREQHYAVAADIGNLFGNSVKVLQHADKGGDPNITMHRFSAPLNFDNATAYITVKETRQHGKRMYSVELMEIEKLGGMLEEARKNPLHTSPPQAFTNNIQNNSPYSTKKDEAPKNILAEKSVEMEMDHQLRLKRLEKSFANNQTHRSQMQADQATKAARQSAGYKSGPDEGITFVERQLTEQKHLTFMGSKLSGTAKIKSSSDVAFLFRNLESAATENGFVVMIKPDESYSVLYLGTGGTNSTSMEISHIAAAAREMGAVKVSMVHNHPSGLVEASPEDFKVHSVMVKALQGLDIEVMPSVIINLDSGKYGEFSSYNTSVREKATGSQGKTKPVKIMQFDRLKMHVPSSQKQVVSTPKDIAEFLSRQKRGTAAKVHAIILSNDNSISRYALLDGDLPYKGLLSQLTAEIGKHGNHVVLATNGSINAFTLNEMKADLKEMGIALIDVIEVKENEEVIKNYRSLVGSRELNEPKAEYGKGEATSQPDDLFTVAERANKKEPHIAEASTAGIPEGHEGNPDIRFSLTNKEDPHAWHGSPHKFDKFSNDYMGTGEGQQAYGWGQYFTDKKGIAEVYANRHKVLNLTEFKELNPDLTNKPFKNMILRDIKDGASSKDELIGFLKDRLEPYEAVLDGGLTNDFSIGDLSDAEIKEKMKKINEAIDYVENDNVNFGNKGNRNLYKVQLHDGKTVDELNFIRWDKNLTDKQIKQIAELAEKEYIYMGKNPTSEKSGRELYNYLAKYQFNSPKAASEFLLRAGIDGVQFPSEYTSKGSHENAYNYVVFDDKAISIKEHTQFSLNKSQREIADNDPERRIWKATRDFLGVGSIDEAFKKFDEAKTARRHQREAGMEVKKRDDLDMLAEKLAEDPELRVLINYDGDEAGAGYKALDIASDYDKLTDKERRERGERFSNEHNRTDSEAEKERREYEKSEEGRKHVNDTFNEKLERFTLENADSTIFELGHPSETLLKAGIEDKQLKLYGNKLLKKMVKHDFKKTDLKDLPNAVNDPIAIFKGSEKGSFAILTEVKIKGDNVLVALAVGKGEDIDFNIIRSAYGKDGEAIKRWAKEGKLLYVNEEKAPDYLRIPAPIAGTIDSQGSTSNIHNFSEKSTETDKKSEKIDKTRQNEPEKGQNETKDGDLLNALANYKETKARKAQRNLQDKFSFAKTIDDVLGLKGADSFYTMETLRHGKKAWLAEKFQEKFADPINKVIADNNLALDDVNDFLYANHALDKNRHLRETEDVKDGSGMSDEEAKAILKDLTAKDGDAYRKIRELNRALNEWKRDLAVEAGVWSKEEAARWAELYPDYVPLKGLSEELQEKLFGFSGGAGTGMGTQAAKGVQKAHGRKTKAPNVLEQNLAQAMAMISNAENNKTMKALYATAKNNKIEGFWDIDPEIKDRGKTLNFGDPFYSQAAADVGKNSMVHVFLNGEKHFIRFKTEAGMSLAKNIKDLDHAQRYWLLKGMMSGGRFVKGMFTSYNPVFVPFNGIKDFQHGIFRAFAVDGAGVAAKTAFYTAQVVPATFGIDIAKGASGKKIDMGEWDKWRDKWKQAGGQVGYIQVNNWRDYSSKMQSQLKDTQRKGYNPKKIGNNFLNAIEAANSDIENGIRLAYFRVLVEKGTSVEEAAAKSKDLTANFNRKGEMDFLDAPFLFFNAGMQGAASLLSPIVSKDKKVRARAWGAAGGLVLAAYAIGMCNRSIAGDDESGENAYDKIPEYEKRLNLIIMQKNGEAIKIPIPYGLNVIYNMGRLAEAAANSESDNYKGASLGLHMFDNIESSFNFFGSDLDPNEISMSLATIAQGSFIATPFANIAANKDFAGRPIAPENKPEWKPESQNYKEGVNPLFKDLAIWLNEVTGGGDGEEYGAEFEGKIRKGLIDWNPHNMEYIWNFATGGLGRIAQQGIGMVRSVGKGEEIQPRQVPFYSRVKYKPSPSQDAGAVWETKNETAGIRAQKKSYLDQTKEADKAGDDTSAQEAKLGKFYEAAAMREAFGSQASKGENSLKKMIEHGAKTKDDLNKFRAAVAKNRKLVDNIQEAYNKHKGDPVKKKQLEEKFNQAVSDMMKSLD